MSFNTALGYFNPYMMMGNQAMNTLSPIYTQNAQNPMQSYNNIMQGFSLNPSQQYQQQMGEQAISNNNATKGLLGSGQMSKDLYDYGQHSTDMYQQQYLNNILGIQNTGLSGLMNQSQLGMQGATSSAQLQEAMNQINAMQQNSLLSGLFGLGGNMLGGLFGMFG